MEYFAIYWIGLQLRKYNSSFASNLIPHSDYVPPFYNLCLKYFTMFLDTSPISLDAISVTTVYLSLITHDVLPKCCIKIRILILRMFFRTYLVMQLIHRVEILVSNSFIVCCILMCF